ncbi:uncharacterized protein N7459_001292 [Penicillium hispanicum]|uniref:uncharacterized protein n=1 Tax=Penicillium hispanicum TaxID=1080232 RepID=UPI002540AEB2|nr:uncharacterized protein N7459_001292 [Penicillium hispanicum]KAJ5595084.1 hypothetical protein N7459_001292 [Penicillium hispanicum]
MNTQASLQGLPVELIQEILLVLPDIATLKATINTCHLLHAAFKENEERIVKRILQDQIEPELFHDALAAMASSQRKLWKKKQADAFLKKYFDRDGGHFLSSCRWKLSQVQPLIENLELVNSFTQRFWYDCLMRPRGVDDHIRSSRPTSRTERIRIGRTFYRFETYCNLFRGYRHILEATNHRHCGAFVTRQRYKYFARFAPWENEQFACVYQFLFRITSPEKAILEVRAKELIENRGSGLQNYTPDETDYTAIEYVLSRGLASIQRFLNLPPLERLDVIQKSETHGHFLGSVLYKGTFQSSRRLMDLDEDEEKIFLPPAWYPDDDCGPQAIWYLNHFHVPVDRLFAHSEAEEERAWGYVMWDTERLEEHALIHPR